MVARETAIGPRQKGGLSNMSWQDHVQASVAQWVLRYIHPADSSWKKLLDGFILRDARGDTVYPEGRKIVMCDLSLHQKRKLLQRLPKKMSYIRDAFKAFWKMKIRPRWEGPWTGIAAESPWYGHRMKLPAPAWLSKYLRLKQRVLRVSDFIDKRTDRPFDRQAWEEFVIRAETDAGRPQPTAVWVLNRVTAIRNVQAHITWGAILEMETPPRREAVEGSPVYVVRGQQYTPARYTEHGGGRLRLLTIDAIGREHLTGRSLPAAAHTITPAIMWDDRWVAPLNFDFVGEAEWRISRKGVDHDPIPIDEFTIKIMTRKCTCARMKPPAAEAAWDKRLGRRMPWSKIWKMKRIYSTPRDEIPMLKFQHRTLWVGKHGGTSDDTCNAHGCNTVENQIHLVECRTIRQRFWDKVRAFLRKVGLPEEDTPQFLGLGVYQRHKVVEKEGASVLFIAWRCLYAEVVRARLEQKTLRLEYAYARTIGMVRNRTLAYGYKWRRWVIRNTHKQETVKKVIPRRHQRGALIKMDKFGQYTLTKPLVDEFEKVKEDTRQRR